MKLAGASDANALPWRRLAGRWFTSRGERAAAPVSHFEFWPGWMFYTPIVVQWILLGLRHGDMSLPTAANPFIEVGGLCGESKSAILDQVATEQRGMIAPYTCFPATTCDAAERAMAAAGLGWPVIAKPDIGCNGAGVRLLADRDELAAYLAAFPSGAGLVLQRYVPEEGEAGLFYVRRPSEAHGRITSVTLKRPPYVVGDGHSTLEALIRADPRAGRIPEMYLPRLGARRAEVPKRGERVRLVLVGNHCKGSIFEDGRAEITPALSRRVDEFLLAMPGFHFGRIDVRFGSVAALRRGEDLTVIEINGVGSEATHVWDARTSLREAWADQLAHYRMAFEIGRELRARGHRPSGVAAMYRHLRLQRRLMATYPLHD